VRQKVEFQQLGFRQEIRPDDLPLVDPDPGASLAGKGAFKEVAMVLASVVNQEDLPLRHELFGTQADAHFFEGLATRSVQSRLAPVDSSTRDRESGLVGMADDEDFVFFQARGLEAKYDMRSVYRGLGELPPDSSQWVSALQDGSNQDIDTACHHDGTFP